MSILKRMDMLSDCCCQCLQARQSPLGVGEKQRRHGPCMDTAVVAETVHFSSPAQQGNKVSDIRGEHFLRSICHEEPVGRASLRPYSEIGLEPWRCRMAQQLIHPGVLHRIVVELLAVQVVACGVVMFAGDECHPRRHEDGERRQWYFGYAQPVLPELSLGGSVVVVVGLFGRPLEFAPVRPRALVQTPDLEEQGEDKRPAGRVAGYDHLLRIAGHGEDMAVAVHRLPRLRWERLFRHEGIFQGENARVLIARFCEQGVPCKEDLEVEMYRAHGKATPVYVVQHHVRGFRWVGADPEAAETVGTLARDAQMTLACRTLGRIASPSPVGPFLISLTVEVPCIPLLCTQPIGWET